jgi:hypothetical protein
MSFGIADGIAGQDGNSGPPPGTPEYCASVELLRPNLVLTADATVQGRVTDQTTAAFKNSPIELSDSFRSGSRRELRKYQPMPRGSSNLGTFKHGEYRLLLSPNRGFKQPEKLQCSSRTCTLDAILTVNPTDQLASSCPIR